MTKFSMKLIGANGRELKIGSRITMDDDRCWIIGMDEVEGGANIHIEAAGGNSWSVDPESVGAHWDEEDFVNHFFEARSLDN